MEREGLAPGDEILLAGTPEGHDAKRFVVAAPFEPVADPMKLAAERLEVRLHLPDLLDFDRSWSGGEMPDDPPSLSSVDALVVGLAGEPDPVEVARFTTDVAAGFPTVRAAPSAPSDEDAAAFVVLDRFHLAIAIVTVLGSTAFLLALMVMRAEERRHTVGVLRLIGLGRPRVLATVLAEGLVVALAGALFGVAVAGAVQGGANAFFQWYYDTSLVFVRVTPRIALESIAIAVPLGIAAGFVASWALLRREIPALLKR